MMAFWSWHSPACLLQKVPGRTMLDNDFNNENGSEVPNDNQQIRVHYREISQDLPDGSTTFGPIETVDIKVDETDERISGTDGSGRHTVVFERWNRLQIRARSGDDESPTRFVGDVERIEEVLR